MDDEADEREEWYENDLQLAAELGKALLERNRDLEGQLFQTQQVTEDQQLEIDYLNHQLDTLRESSEAKNKIYEEIDKTIQDLESRNQKHIIDSKADKQKMDRLAETVRTLEEKNEELSKRVEDLKAAERERKKMQQQQNKDTRRARSLANLPDNKENLDICYERIGNWTYNERFKNSNLPLNPYEIEIRNQQEIIKRQKAQNMLDKRKREDFETEVALLWEENTSLEVKIKILEEDLLKYKKLQDDIQKIKMESGKYCINCGKTLGVSKKNILQTEVEDDEPQFNSEGKIVKMESGGSVYGSRESLDQVAMETKETMTSIDSPENPDDAGISILNELELQYQSLFKRYEMLLQKGKRPSSLLLEDDEEAERELEKRLSNKAVQTTIKLTKPGDDLENPPYKMIFRDIFATLKKSRIEESGEASVTSPEMQHGKATHSSSPVPDAR
ncbi:cerebellar degeneration-related protein 2-like [Mercenaria mercenaria]|uniref:cerebellar degeneration-related protein 2-like n=1 Tax=Mercenaria mercenaria TaxID=6596 RepID=UPI001E1DB973|nr:cerebellar degeneration-related protein 2-like [Mercenaria mercenaria]